MILEINSFEGDSSPWLKRGAFSPTFGKTKYINNSILDFNTKWELHPRIAFLMRNPSETYRRNNWSNRKGGFDTM